MWTYNSGPFSRQNLSSPEEKSFSLFKSFCSRGEHFYNLFSDRISNIYSSYLKYQFLKSLQWIKFQILWHLIVEMNMNMNILKAPERVHVKTGYKWLKFNAYSFAMSCQVSKIDTKIRVCKNVITEAATFYDDGNHLVE